MAEVVFAAQAAPDFLPVEVVFTDGQERTLAQMGRVQEETDRARREAAWKAVAARRLSFGAVAFGGRWRNFSRESPLTTRHLDAGKAVTP